MASRVYGPIALSIKEMPDAIAHVDYMCEYGPVTHGAQSVHLQIRTSY